MEARSSADGLGPLAGAADVCLVFDLGGSIVAANDSAARVLGYTAEDLLGRRAWDVCSCLTENGFDWAVEALRAEGPQSLFGHLRRRDGTLHSTDTHLWLARMGSETRVFALARDLRGHQGVVEERERLAHLVEASSELVAQFDEAGRLTYVNPAGLALLGIERVEDASGLTLAELFALDQRTLIEETVLPRAQRERWEGPLLLRSWQDDRRTPCWAQVFAVRHSRSRKPEGLALVARDETERVAAEARRGRLLRLTEVSRHVATSLLVSDDLNEAIFQILSGVTVTLGATRSFLNRFRDRRWVLRTHRWSLQEGACHRVAAPAEPEESQRWATVVLERKEALRITDAAALHPPQGRGLLEPGERALLALPVFIQGELTGVFGFVCDQPRDWEDDEVAGLQITVDSFARGVERQIAEREKREALRELERAVERERVASRYKSEFLASMSHELRTPMNAIRGYAELLGRPNPERDLQGQWIQNLHRSTEYLLGLVHDVLDLSKIEAGHMVLERESTALADVLTSVHDLLAAGAREKCLEFRFEIDGEVPERFSSDPVRLKQILVNLTANAIKFTSEGSIVVSARRHDATLEVAVRDTGIGIPADALDRLFQPFAQLHARSEGTGLGLQISRSLARLLGGDIRVTSEVGRGSTFVLEVPLENPSGSLRQLPLRALASRPTARALPAALRDKRLLVVDDSHENREVLRFLLQDAGAACETAVDGRAGIERALSAQRAGTPYDAILMDMNMPVLDGFEATRRLRRAGIASPVIALTALALAGDEERCREAGCVAYVAKPIVPSTFFDVLARHVGGDTAASTAPVAAEGAREDGHALSLAQHPRFRGLVERYLASFPELVRRLRKLERAGEVEEMRTLVHRLRGTAASYGFPGVSQAAGCCEDAIRAGEGREEIARKLEDLLGRLDVAVAG